MNAKARNMSAPAAHHRVRTATLVERRTATCRSAAVGRRAVGLGSLHDGTLASRGSAVHATTTTSRTCRRPLASGVHTPLPGSQELGRDTASLSGMDFPDGYELRAPAPDDLDAVADVFIADDLDDAGEVVLDADFLRAEWSRPDFDLAADAWVVVDATGTIVGLRAGHARRPNVVDSWGIVHPAHRGRGIGPRCWTGSSCEPRSCWPAFRHPRFRHSINAGDARRRRC